MVKNFNWCHCVSQADKLQGAGVNTRPLECRNFIFRGIHEFQKKEVEDIPLPLA
jgi:hypothetical protein